MSYSQNLLRASALALSLMSVAACGGPSYEQSGATPQSQHVRRIPAMSADVHKALQQAQEALDERAYDTADVILQSLLERERINGYERAVVWQLRAQVAFETDDLQGTIHAYEQILTLADMIPEALEIGIIYNLSQLYYSTEDYDTALAYLQRWENRIDPGLISVSNLQYIANLHYVRGDYEQALHYINEAIAVARALPTVRERETWHYLRLSANWELGRKDQVEHILHDRLQANPQSSHCYLLAGLYVDKGMAEDAALTATREAYTACAQANQVTSPGKRGVDTSLKYQTTSSDDVRDYLPLVRVQPQYPRKAIEDKVTGYVVIELTVMKNGSVDPNSIKILEAEPAGYFEDTVRSAASKFKYKPKTVRGVAQTVTGVQYRFNFDLGESILNAN